MMNMDPTTIIDANKGLSFIITLLIGALGIIWKAYQKELTYNKEQDKENLIMLVKVTEISGDVYKQGEKTEEKINILSDKSADILRILEERFKKPT